MSFHTDLYNYSDLHRFYKSALLDDCVPFWIHHSLDFEYGGYLTMLECDGSPYGFNKYVWPQARTAYLFAKLYNMVERKADWLAASQLGIEFLKKHALHEDGWAYYKLTRDGSPIYSRPWEIYAESFIVMAFSEYSAASGKEEYLEAANKLYWKIIKRLQNNEIKRPGEAKYSPYIEHAPTMIMINTTQELRNIQADPRLDEFVAAWVKDELYIFARDEQKAMFERVGRDGKPQLNEPEGRSITPGHCMESCWFCIREGEYRQDRSIIERAIQIIDWTMNIGWDQQYGGIFNFVDYEGKPPGHHDEDWGEDQDWDAKLFWVHSEALYALLLASVIKGEERFRRYYEKVHHWSFKYFPDPRFGEWFGYLRRDGSISQTMKGCVKSFFHVPRAFLNCMKLLEKQQS